MQRDTPTHASKDRLIFVRLLMLVRLYASLQRHFHAIPAELKDFQKGALF